MSGYATSWYGVNSSEIKDPFYLLKRVSRANSGSMADQAWLKNRESTANYFSIVSIIDSRRSYQLEFMLVPRGYRDVVHFDKDVITAEAPLGAAVKGAQVGETRTYWAPTGRAIEMEILSVRFPSESELSVICERVDAQGGLSNSGRIYAVDFKYNITPIESMPQYVHGSMPARQRMGG